MNSAACSFFGHRHLPADKTRDILLELDRAIEILIARGVTDFISGGAPGFDQIAATLIVAKKETGKDIRLIFALPYHGQDEWWSRERKGLFKNLLDNADGIIYVSQSYDPFCMERRNRYIVEHSAYCICALLSEKGKTARAVHYARQKGLEVINIAK